MASRFCTFHPDLDQTQAEQLLLAVGLDWTVEGVDREGVHVSRELPLPISQLVAEMALLGDGWLMGSGLGSLERAQQALREQVKDFAGVGLTKIEGQWGLALRQQHEAPADWTPPTRFQTYPVHFSFVGLPQALQQQLPNQG